MGTAGGISEIADISHGEMERDRQCAGDHDLGDEELHRDDPQQ